MRRMTRVRMVRYWAILMTLSMVLIGCLAPDLTITNIEITQAIQTPTNTVQLVAQRTTAVRVTIDTGSGVSVANVTGRLHVFVDGLEITPAAGLPPINTPLTAPASPQRANENDTLNFELPAPTGITASTDVDFRVDIEPVPGETATSNNSGEVNDLTFVDRTTPTLYFTRLDYTPAGLGLPPLADVQPGVGDSFVRGIYPVNDGDPNLYRQGLFPTLTFSQDDNGNNVLDSSPEGNALLSFLASCRQLIVDAGLGANNNTFLYGWIAGNPISGNGLGQVGGFNAYGNTQHIRHQRTYAHELGHNFGLNHNSRTLDEVGWDVGARLDGNPTGNSTTDQVKPTILNDIMRGGQLTDSAWVDTITYNFFLGSSILASADSADMLASAARYSIFAQEREFSDRVAVIQGIFDPQGSELVYLQPVFRFPWPSQPAPREQVGQFAAEVVDEAGSAQRVRFDARVADDSGEAGEEQIGFFEVMVAVDPTLEISSVRITDAEGQREFGGFFERSEPPEIVIVAPEEGAELSEETEVAWEVRDPDTQQEELLYQLAYSPDNGQTWVPIAVDVPGEETSIVFNSTQIQASEGRGVIRVFVGDGLNTAFADVSELTTLAAQFPPPGPGDEGRAPVLIAEVAPHETRGAPYPPAPPVDMVPNEDEEFEPVPTGPRRGNLEPANDPSRIVEVDPFGDRVNGDLAMDEDRPRIDYKDYAEIGEAIPATSSCCPEPSVAENGDTIMMTGNLWMGLSEDGGASFTSINPTTLFPQDDGGLCCDQVVQYVPQIDMFVWLMQYWSSGGQNRIRIAAQTTPIVRSSNGRAWTYWDFESEVFRDSGSLDYNDMSFGRSNLYWTSQIGGRIVVRMPLNQIAAKGTITFGYTGGTDAKWSHVTHNATDTVYWAGHKNNSELRVYSMRDSDGFYSWRTVNINSWPNGTNSSLAPNGTDWMTFELNKHYVYGNARQGSSVWFGWLASDGGGFPHPHVQLVAIDTNSFTLNQQVQVWNPDFAFIDPYLSTNLEGELGMSIAFGGGPFYTSHAVGVWGDFVVYYPRLSTRATNRWGDYNTSRRSGRNGLEWVAAGYTNDTDGSGNNVQIPHYIRFGR